MANLSSQLQQCVFIVIALAVVVTSLPASPQPVKRQKRHLMQLCELIAYHTNRGCLDYNNYGCFCGLGNAASHHVDGVDGCCRVHDNCYGQVSCSWLMYPQIVRYAMNCTEDGCQCTDSPTMSRCAYTTCQCDVQLAQCLSRQRYNHVFSGYDRRQCNNNRRPRLTAEERLRRRRRRRRRREGRMRRRSVNVENN